MANQAGELIQLENNISQKQKEVFWFYPAIKIPWSSSLWWAETLVLAHCCGPQIAREENVLAVVMAAEVHQTAAWKGLQG